MVRVAPNKIFYFGKFHAEYSFTQLAQQEQERNNYQHKKEDMQRVEKSNISKSHCLG
jgi:hypothetical protein